MVKLHRIGGILVFLFLCCSKLGWKLAAVGFAWRREDDERTLVGMLLPRGDTEGMTWGKHPKNLLSDTYDAEVFQFGVLGFLLLGMLHTYLELWIDEGDGEL